MVCLEYYKMNNDLNMNLRFDSYCKKYNYHSYCKYCKSHYNLKYKYHTLPEKLLSYLA